MAPSEVEPGDEATPRLRKLHGYRTFIIVLSTMALSTSALHAGRITGGDWQVVMITAIGLYGVRRWTKGASE